MQDILYIIIISIDYLIRKGKLIYSSDIIKYIQ